MAKSKNTSHHNQNKKAHRNGIPRPKKSVYKQMSLKGVDPKVTLDFLINLLIEHLSSSETCDSLRRATRRSPRNKSSILLFYWTLSTSVHNDNCAADLTMAVE